MNSKDFKGIYIYKTGSENITKIHGHSKLPEIVNVADVKNFYRYDSGAKEFKQMKGNK